MSDEPYTFASPLLLAAIDRELHVGDRVRSPVDLPLPGEQPLKAGDVLTIVEVHQDGPAYIVQFERDGVVFQVSVKVTGKSDATHSLGKPPVHKELDVVHLAKDFDTKRGIVKKGTVATILQVFAGGEAYQVEFEGEHEPPETVKADYLS